jgi:hypothetical protein
MSDRHPLMRTRWLTGWITHPSRWIDVALFAAIGLAVLFIVVVMLGWP